MHNKVSSLSTKSSPQHTYRRHKRVLGVILIIILLELLAMGAIYMQGVNFAVLNPKGTIAFEQRNLMIIATALSLIVVIPVFALTFFIAWKYRASNTKATYSPNWDHNKKLEAIWWGVPIALIIILGVMTWTSSHRLDPRRPIASSKKPITIQVIALEWKWLFIYPEYNLASVNYIQLPEDTPINFEITADAPMNSFWIPQLGGQIYAMNGMKTRLNLMASDQGTYRGLSANMSGEGFADMKFTVRAVSQDDFDEWTRMVKQSPDVLDNNSYSKLAKPSKNNQLSYYTSQASLFDTIIMKYMAPPGAGQTRQHQAMQGMNHETN